MSVFAGILSPVLQSSLMFRPLWVGAAFTVALLSTSALAQTEDFSGVREVMIPMRDGVKLATDLYFPPANMKGPYPVLVQRTPYNKRNKNFTGDARFFAENGYLVALQDCRGRYRSEGVFFKYVSEPKDGYDTIEWLAKLPESNGRVGMWGTSYGAHVQAAASKLNPPHLRTVVLNMGGMSNGWLSGIRNHGAFELKQVNWAFNQIRAETKDPNVRARFAQEDLLAWVQAMPWRRGLSPLAVAPNIEDYVLNMLTNSDYGDYWRDMSVNWVEHYEGTADIPMIHVSGWWDEYLVSHWTTTWACQRSRRAPSR